MSRKYSLKPDKHDSRDFIYKMDTISLPESVDMRPRQSPVVDQGALGSCTANAIGSGFREYLQIRDGHPLTLMSRLYLYWHERELMGTINEDSGAYIRDGFKVLQTLGCAPESRWVYDVTKFTQRPSSAAEEAAAQFKINEYNSVLTFEEMQQALSDGLPVVIGIKVYESFESYNTGLTGIVTVPKDGEAFLGGHAVLVVGYKKFNDGVTYAIVKNSWGDNWGVFGYCYIPKDYFDKGFVMDMWTGNVIAPKKVSPYDLTFKDAIDIAVKYGIFDTPEFWTVFEERYNAGTLTNGDYEWVLLGFRKWAADAENQRGL